MCVSVCFFTSKSRFKNLISCPLPVLCCTSGGLISRALAEFVGAQVGRLALAPEPKDKIVALMRAVSKGSSMQAPLLA
jgi:hypothetical protein